LNGARTDALQQAESDQHRHRGRKAGEQRADEEDDDAEDQHRLAAKNVGQLTVDDGRCRLRQQERRKHPRVIGEAAEVADDARHGCRDDGGFDRHHEVGEHDGGDDIAAPAGAHGNRHVWQTRRCRKEASGWNASIFAPQAGARQAGRWVCGHGSTGSP